MNERPERTPDASALVDRLALERLDLEQALIDVELANARVVDLTGRVTSMSGDLLSLRAEVGNLQLALAQERAEANELRATIAELLDSRAFRVARRAGDLKARLVRR